jgi:hypothetical protein
VGRDRELRQFAELLAEKQRAPVVFHVQGMPGIGKSALLDELAELARAEGHAVHVVRRDQTAVERARDVMRRLSRARQRSVVVIDDWDGLAAEEPPLLERLEKVDEPLVLVLGSRVRPSAQFMESGLFPERLRVVELGGLGEADSIAMLASHGIEEARAKHLHHECAGQPFAMLLFAGLPRDAEPNVQLHVMREFSAHRLVQRFVGSIKEPLQSQALELLSLVGTLNEHELRVGLGISNDEARSLFDFLGDLTIVQSTPGGLVVSPVVRMAIVADLHMRDPNRARAMVTSILEVIEENRRWRGNPGARATDQLRTLAANAPQDPAQVKMFEDGSIRVTRARQRDHAEVFALIESFHGSTSRAIAERLVAFQPESLLVVREASGIEGLMIRVELRGASLPDAIEEPVLAALVAALDRAGELPDDMLLRVSRFFLSRRHGQTPCLELAALGASITQQSLDSSEPFMSAVYIEGDAVETWRGFLQTTGIVARDDATIDLDGKRQVPFVTDGRDPSAVFLQVVQRAWALSVRDDTPNPPELDDPEAEILRALAHQRDLIWLRSCPLGARLFPSADPDGRAERLQAWLRDAVSATEGMHRGDLVSKALRASFETTRSIEEAAAAAHMSVSTLKRYRRMGIRQIVELAKAVDRTRPA